MKRIQFAIVSCLALVFASPLWAASEGTAGEEGPRAVIESTVNDIVHILEARKDTSKMSAADREAIRHAIQGRFDYTAMASRSLGKPWRKIDSDERAHFTELFRELLERSYGNRLSGYKGQKIVFANAEEKGDKARVKSTVIDGTRETPVEYRLHQTPTGWQVYDIRIEGTSMVRTFYQDFQSTLDNGNYQTLVKTLQDKIADLKGKEQS
ncbi:MlaC/ttg2D family ABC transporter substrate-binding protein [Mariprofundus ferrooxydans]|uniref:Toluene tolerance n=1 Tax=Mariprofundus ferrooxydans PV-1 TaxID=314345 RepID=Q0F1F5_9PROT|nr:ABC transporter substrate-binding protein [Mariprofundus ferrooxydans]EAU55236.1 hypothetical protein SPV1_10906 [Mariprofundus ferrooxydans PV-1]KON47238.1 hypothetical protein AL013_09485 [Mariprofundus ferrooxydans]